MSSTSIIAKITEIYDKNIEFDQDFFKNETIRGIEHAVIKGKLTYIPDSCDHCNGENKDYMIVKNGNQIMDILIGQFNSKPVILRLTKQRFYCKHCRKTFMAQTPLVANRVMHTVTSWIERELSLKVNATKSKVTKPTRLKYLGFGFVKMNGKWEARPHKDSINRFKRKLKKLTYRSWSVSMDYRILRLNQVIRGWINYFRIGKMKQNMTKIDKHLRNRMRIVIWKQWKTSKKRMWGLRKLGVPEWMARQSVEFADHYQAAVKTTGLRRITKEILAKRGLISCLDYYMN